MPVTRPGALWTVTPFSFFSSGSKDFGASRTRMASWSFRFIFSKTPTRVPLLAVVVLLAFDGGALRVGTLGGDGQHFAVGRQRPGLGFRQLAADRRRAD